MVTELTLARQRILVTRPEMQAETLSGLISQSGGQPIVFPVINIEAIAKQHWQVKHLEHVDWLIFISRNAVDSFMADWANPLPEKIQLAAVGKGTAKAMREAGLRVDCQPEDSTGSEGLLQMSAMQTVSGKHIVIVRGVGGRELLADTLKARGATIAYMEVYRRGLAEHSHQACIRAMYADKVICTSVAGIDNLCRILASFKAELLYKPLVVVSERLAEHARALGFRWVVVSADASDSSVLETLIEMDKQHGKQ